MNPSAENDQGFVLGWSPRDPLLASDLLALLDASDASRTEQHSAVNDWLTRNEPNRLLRDDLRDHGFPAKAS